MLDCVAFDLPPPALSSAFEIPRSREESASGENQVTAKPPLSCRAPPQAGPTDALVTADAVAHGPPPVVVRCVWPECVPRPGSRAEWPPPGAASFQACTRS